MGKVNAQTDFIAQLLLLLMYCRSKKMVKVFSMQPPYAFSRHLDDEANGKRKR